MNDDLSDTIEQALKYASPLPVTSTDDNMTIDTPEPEGKIENVIVHEDECVTKLEEFLCGISEDNGADEELNNILFPDCSEKSRPYLSQDSISSLDALGVSDQNYSIHSSVIQSQDRHSDVTDKVKDSPDLANSVELENLDFGHLETCAIDESKDSELSQILSEAALTDVHPNKASGLVSDVFDKTEVGNFCEQMQGKLSKDFTSSIVSSETDELKPKVKRRRRREKNRDPAPPPVLPPCSICDEKSSGYHYGANTCEACKGFYRRTLKKNEVDYKCKCLPDDKERWKRGPLKNGCPACRYEKCLAVGMSKNAIKIGRYTLNHKTRNIKEVKSIKTIDSFITALTETMLETTSSSADLETFTAAASNEDIAELFTDQPDDDNIPLKRQKLSSPGPPGNTVLSLREIESVVKTLTEAHTTLHLDERINMSKETIRKRQYEYLEKYKVKLEVFGSMGNLTKDEITDFYNITGIDIDGRIKQVHDAFKFFKKKVPTIVEFAKAIPGFKALGLKDQANLIKASRMENSMVAAYKTKLKCTDKERQVVTTAWGAHMHLDEIKSLIPTDLRHKKRAAMEKLLELSLSVQEEAVLRAILIVSSDRCRLDEPHKVDLIQEKLVACLQHLINIRPGSSGTLLYRIFNLMTNLRDVTDREMSFAKSFLVEWPILSLDNYNLLKNFVT